MSAPGAPLSVATQTLSLPDVPVGTTTGTLPLRGPTQVPVVVHFFVSSSQWRHAFGITAREIPRPGPETDWYRAYQSVESNGEADETNDLEKR